MKDVINENEIIEYQEDYEKLVEKALFNFENNNNINLNKLILKGIKEYPKKKIGYNNININEIEQSGEKNNIGVFDINNKIINPKNKNESNSIEENDKNNQIIYQVFEDESENEENIDSNEVIQENYLKTNIDILQEDKNKIGKKQLNKSDKNKNEKGGNSSMSFKPEINTNCFSKIEEENIVLDKIKLTENINNKKNKKKLNVNELKNRLIKINYEPPEWARNMSDQDFIKKINNILDKK